MFHTSCASKHRMINNARKSINNRPVSFSLWQRPSVIYWYPIYFSLGIFSRSHLFLNSCHEYILKRIIAQHLLVLGKHVHGYRRNVCSNMPACTVQFVECQISSPKVEVSNPSIWGVVFFGTEILRLCFKWSKCQWLATNWLVLVVTPSDRLRGKKNVVRRQRIEIVLGFKHYFISW